VAGDFSIADIAILPWAKYHEKQSIELAAVPHVRAWLDRVMARPAVQRGFAAV
jgi:GST-like protein